MGHSQIQQLGVSRVRFHEPSAAAAAGVSPTFWLVLLFLLLLYSNLPLLVPALDAVRPAQLIAVLALGMLLVESVFSRRPIDLVWPEGILLLAFVGAAGLSSIRALWLRQAAESLLDLTKVALIFFVLVNSTNTRSRLRLLMWTMVIGGMFPALGALRNYMTGNLIEGRAGWVGIFANPNELAYSLLILLPIAWSLAAGRHPLIRAGLMALSALYIAGMFVSFSRGGLAGLGAVVALYAWRKRSALLMGLLVVGAAGGLAVAGQYWSRQESFSGLEGDLGFQQRLATSQAGLAMFADRPLLGVGLGCSVIAWPLYAPEKLYTRHALALHNTFIQPLSETGLLGFIPFTLLVLLSILYARGLARDSTDPEMSNLAAGLEAALWGFVVCGLTGGYALSWFPYILFGLVASARRIARTT